ncbi:hypothetical protein TNCV_3563081 [Trichonephila clavipes]|nr:hypothetical protein TNCV_3563081 [Trichonephila clavipes]
MIDLNDPLSLAGEKKCMLLVWLSGSLSHVTSPELKGKFTKRLVFASTSQRCLQQHGLSAADTPDTASQTGASSMV